MKLKQSKLISKRSKDLDQGQEEIYLSNKILYQSFAIRCRRDFEHNLQDREFHENYRQIER